MENRSIDNTMKKTPAKTESWRGVGPTCVVVLAISLTAVPGTAGAGDHGAPLPEGAIKVEEGIYQVPIGRDEEGCMMYQMHAPGRDVTQVISYRRADGTFTMAKPETACGEDEPKP